MINIIKNVPATSYKSFGEKTLQMNKLKCNEKKKAIRKKFFKCVGFLLVSQNGNDDKKHGSWNDS